jgi:NADPH:quinone reductase-like Zn-dependent oxidoreductase
VRGREDFERVLNALNAGELDLLVGTQMIAKGHDIHGVTLVGVVGADAALDRQSKNFIQMLRENAPDGIDAVLALAGGELLEQCLDFLKKGARVAYPNGVGPEPKKRRGVTITIKSYNGNAGPREFEKLERAVAESGLLVPVAAVFPLAQASRAHARLEQGHVHGRIALKPR